MATHNEYQLSLNIIDEIDIDWLTGFVKYYEVMDPNCFDRIKNITVESERLIRLRAIIISRKYLILEESEHTYVDNDNFIDLYVLNRNELLKVTKMSGNESIIYLTNIDLIKLFINNQSLMNELRSTIKMIAS